MKIFGRIGSTGEIHWGCSLQKTAYSSNTHEGIVISIRKLGKPISIPSWDEYFLSIAEVVKTRSKDPSTQVGSVIVDDNNHIIATGFNGMPKGFPETPELWDSKEKHQFVTHSEVNAIVNATTALTNATLYTTLFPCSECAKIISASGIKKVISYKILKHPNTYIIKLHKQYNFDLSKEIFKLNNIEVVLL